MFLSIFAPLGELAQLVERLHGMQEVTGSNPVFSTKIHSTPYPRVFFVIIWAAFLVNLLL
ncbi:MAG: hypothetical protein RLZZ05_1132 [Bacteroidota bacterium]|jgi:hypothetical protein